MDLVNTLLVFAYDFPPSSGGISRLCYEIAAGQENYFKEIVVLTRKKQGEYEPVKQANFRLIELPTKRLKCEMEALKVLKKFDASSTKILCSLWYPEAFLALLSGHKNVFSLAHGAELQAGNSKFRKYIWQAIFAKQVLRRIKLVIANSSYTKKLVDQLAKTATSVALPLGVDIDQFKPINLELNNTNFTIGSLSRIHQFKGFDQVLEALMNLPIETQEKITWKIGGTGPYLESFKEKIKHSTCHVNVEFEGFIPDKSLVEFYNQLDVFILFTQDVPSQNSVEGFGLVFLEAQACGVPVIGTRTGGIPDAVDHNNGGWLFEQDDISGLSQQIEILINNRGILIEHSKLARRRCLQNASWENYSKKLKELLG